MTPKNIRQQYRSELLGLYPEGEIDSMFYRLLEHWADKTRLTMSLEPESELTRDQAKALIDALAWLKQEYPVQYLIGEVTFLGRSFKVTKDVLIPRPETEELVHWIISDHKDRASLNLLDVGTGSGCIAVSLACALSGSKCSALDVSTAALKIAEQNASMHKAEVNFLQKDILKAESLPGVYDIIASNPPYVRQNERASMRGNVLKYEPETALYVDNEDPLVFYRAIGKLALNSLKPGGRLYFEINQFMGSETRSLLEELGFGEIALRNDLFGAPRMIRARKF